MKWKRPKDDLKDETPALAATRLAVAVWPRGGALGGHPSPICPLLLLQVRVRFELKSPVKTIEDFLRRFSPCRLTLGCSSLGNLATTKVPHKPGPSSLSALSSNSTLLSLEGELGEPVQAIASNGYSSEAAGWARDPKPELRYEAESPDEAALVYAARAYNCTLAGRLHDQVAVELPHLGRLTFELLHTLGFDSIRKRMSVVIRHPLTDEINVYTKGADSVVMDLLLPCASGTPPPMGARLWAEVPRNPPCPPPPERFSAWAGTEDSVLDSPPHSGVRRHQDEAYHQGIRVDSEG